MVYMGSTPRVGLTHGLRRLLVLALLALCSAHTAPAGGDCAASDASMLHARKMLCNSLVQGHTAWCKDDWQNVSASKDWPSQAHMVDVLMRSSPLPATVEHSLRARHGDFVNRSQSDPAVSAASCGHGSLSGSLICHAVGVRIEPRHSQKCWAFAYLR